METDFDSLPNLKNELTVKEKIVDSDSAIYKTDVLVIGNGPSGLALSAFLSGWRPYYNLNSPHPNRDLHERLVQNVDCSLVDQDLSWSQQSFVDFRSTHPISLLYDCLARPDTDLGHDHPSSLSWKQEEDKSLCHVILGAGPPGGSWHTFNEEMLPVSLSTWLDLPGYSIAQWLNNGVLPAQRLPMFLIRKYLCAYPKCSNTKSHHIPFTTVTHLERVENEWEVRGWHPDGRFCFRAKTVCLASGLNVPTKLGVSGENNNNKVHYTINDLKHSLFLSNDDSIGDISPEKSLQHPILIVGDGLSAADAVIYCLLKNIPLIHCFKRSPKEIRHTMLGRLSASFYREYQKVVKLMMGKVSDPLYTPYPNSKVVRFDPEGSTATLEVQDPKSVHTPSVVQLQYSHVVVSVGRGFTLDYVPPENQGIVAAFGQRVVRVDSITYKSVDMEGLFALGPLAGDYFVRYIVGGCLAAAKEILKEFCV